MFAISSGSPIRPSTEIRLTALGSGSAPRSGRDPDWSECDRQMLDAGEQIGSQTLGRSGRSHVRHAAEQFVEHHAQLESGKIRTNTEMLTVAERDVVVGLAREVEAVGIGEHLLVPIG